MLVSWPVIWSVFRPVSCNPGVRRGFIALAVAGCIALAGAAPAALAQTGQGTSQATGQGSWSAGVRTTPDGLAARGTIDPQAALLTLSAYLTGEIGSLSNRPIARGLVWRVYRIGAASEPPKLIETSRSARPTLRLTAGKYAINAAFGRAHLTQIVDAEAGNRRDVPFVLNAGGLRVVIKAVGGIARDTARYDIFSDERDQSGARLRVITNARPGRITRLNSGIYHIVSRLGDANARVSAEVAVEAGKLTEAVVSHEAAKVTFKLVKTASGEAHADTQWIIMTKSGDIIKESAGALPTHVLAPGSYNVSARRDGQNYSRSFEVLSGRSMEVEVMMR